MSGEPSTGAFVGREQQLDLLWSAWCSVRDGTDGPRAVVLLAEPGLGKTRLAQEFYARLVSAEQGGAGYWPATLGSDADNLRVNPEEGDWDANAEMPFLWWGVRLSDPGERNRVATGALAAHVESFLVPHLEPFHREQRRRQRVLQLAKLGGAVAADAVIDLVPFLGLVKKVGEIGLELRGIHDEWRTDARQIDAAEALAGRRASLVERLLADLDRLFTGPAGRRVPVVILLDDAQFSAADPSVTAFVDKLLPAMTEGRWPLLLVVTHWEHEWFAGGGEPSEGVSEGVGQGPGAGAASVAARLRAYGDEQLDGVRVIRLEPVADLAPLAVAGMPGLDAAQVEALVERAGGNPRFMEELIQYATSTRGRALFEARDPTGRMTDKGLATLLAKSVELSELVAERLGGAPDDVQRAISLAGLQGEEFSDSLLAATAGELEPAGEPLTTIVGAGDAIDLAASPYAVVSRVRPGAAAFNQRLYREVARELLPAWYDEDHASLALRTVVRETMLGERELHDADSSSVMIAAVWLFEDAADPDDLRLASHGLHELLLTALRSGDLHVAHALARRQAATLERLPDSHLDSDLAWLRAANEALAAVGDENGQRPLLLRLIELTGATYDEDVNAWSTTMYLEALLDAAEFHDARGDGERQAAALWQAVDVLAGDEQRAVDLTQVGAEERAALLRSSLRLHRLHADFSARSGAIGDALTLQRHAAEIAEQLRELDDSPASRFEAAASRARVGGAALADGDTAVAIAELGAALEGLRSLEGVASGTGFDITLATTLDDLAQARADDGDLTQAVELQGESVELMRKHLAAAPQAARPQRNLADSLERLADLEQRRDNLDDAWKLLEEAVTLREQVAASLHGTSRGELGVAMARAARVAFARGEVGVAHDLASRGVELLRGETTEEPDVTARWRLLFCLEAAIPATTAVDGLQAGLRLLQEAHAVFAQVPEEARGVFSSLARALESHRTALAERVGGDLNQDLN